MWIFSNDSFLSVVAYESRDRRPIPGLLLVRPRTEGDLRRNDLARTANPIRHGAPCYARDKRGEIFITGTKS